MKARLVLSHANGFPAPVYACLAGALAERFRVTSVERFGHDPRYPVSPGWSALTRQLIDHVRDDDDGAPVWLAGHSLGGYLSVLAAAGLGERVAGVVLLDSPLISGLGAHAIRLGRCTGLDRHMMPLAQTLQRRVCWPDVEAVHGHFAAKPAFAGWHPQVLRDYAAGGTEPDGEGGRRLLFDREVEYRIYRSLPTGSVARTALELRAPVGFLAGTRSREVRYIGLRGTRRVVGPRLAWIEGGHLFPMEKPHETAQAMLAMIDAMASGPAALAGAGRAA